MPDFFNQKVLDNSILAYLVVFACIAFAILLKRFLSRQLAAVIFRWVMKSDTTINKQGFISLIVQPLDLFLVLFVAFAAIDRLNYPSAFNLRLFRVPLHTITDALFKGVLVVVFIWLLLRIIDFAAYVLEEKALKSADQNNNQLIVFFKDFFKVLLTISGGLLLLKFSFNQNIGNLFTGLSIVGAAIALATRESLENLIASFIIFFDKPFTTGDTVKVEGFTGSVEKIGLRSTRVRTDNKTYITIPNKKMVDSILDNISMRTHRRVEQKLFLSLQTPGVTLQQVAASIKNILQNEHVDGMTVYVSESGRDGHVISIEYLVNVFLPNEAFVEKRQQINLSIIALLAENKIDFAESRLV